MVTKLRDVGGRLVWLIGLSAALPLPGWAQTQTTAVRPRIDLQVLATTNAGASGGGLQGKKEMILTATPGVSVMTRGTNTELEGLWQFNAIHYVRNSQPDRVLPNGLLKLHTEFVRRELGLDASLAASQVRSTVTARTSETPNTSDSYTNTTLRLSPFAQKQLDPYTLINARLDRGVLHTTQTGQGLIKRPDSYTVNDLISLARQPTPLGYKVEASRQQTRMAGQADPSLNERLGRLTAWYTPTPDFRLGASLGRASTRLGAESVSETLRGWQVQWRPTERSVLKADVEDRFFGKSWHTDISHRMPWLAMGLSAERTIATYATTLGNIGQGGSLSGLYDAMLTTRIPDAAERRKAVDDLVARRNLSSQVSTSGDVYDVTAQLRQAINGRLSIMGRRDIVTIVGGLVKTAPLAAQDDPVIQPLQAGNRTKEHYLDAQLNHQLTPQSTLSGGLRWTRARTVALGTQTDTLAREFSWRAALSTNLARDTSATMGLRRQITHTAASASAAAATNTNETAMYVGLGHRF